jgi:hypothetical protein
VRYVVGYLFNGDRQSWRKGRAEGAVAGVDGTSGAAGDRMGRVAWGAGDGPLVRSSKTDFMKFTVIVFIPENR